MRHTLAALLTLIASTAIAADPPDHLKPKIEQARRVRESTIRTLTANKPKPDSKEAEKLSELLSGGLPEVRMLASDLQVGQFGSLIMRRAVIHAIIDDTTMIIIPIVTNSTLSGGKIGVTGGNQVLYDGAGTPLVIHGIATAGKVDGKDIAAADLGVLEVSGTEKVKLSDGRTVTVFTLKPFDPQQLAPFIGKPATPDAKPSK